MRLKIKNNKKAAMEMSVGTIVTIVLLMGVLVLGIFLIRQIFGVAKGAIDMTEQQIMNELRRLYTEDAPLMIFPSSKYLEIKHGKSDAIGLGIRNLYEDDKQSNTFSYEVSVSESTCGAFDPIRWIEIGKTATGLTLAKGGDVAKKISFKIPEGSPLCIAEFKIDVKVDNQPWKIDFFQIRVK